MKKLFALFLLVAATIGVGHAQSENTGNALNGPKIKFDTMIHDYGTIEKGADGNCEFSFTNIGNEPLILSMVKASCGCTTPSWTQKPVMPGKTGTISVHYNTNNTGAFNKSITVTSNAVNEPRVVLRIKGNVTKPESTEQN